MGRLRRKSAQVLIKLVCGIPARRPKHEKRRSRDDSRQGNTSRLHAVRGCGIALLARGRGIYRNWIEETVKFGFRLSQFCSGFAVSGASDNWRWVRIYPVFLEDSFNVLLPNNRLTSLARRRRISEPDRIDCHA